MTPGRGTTAETADLEAGMDFRLREHRRETFQRWYEHQLRWAGHPGGVYYLMPWLAATYGWDAEARLWFAFLNGHTQHPVTSLILHRRFPGPEHTEAMLRWYQEHYAQLAVDTDRRHHKPHLPAAARYYARMTACGQQAFWDGQAEGGFGQVWAAATSIPSFGRLSTFSYTEYLAISGVPVECDHLFLDDLAGSRSHRNGLAIVLGRDDLDWHASNPSFDGRYDRRTLAWLADEADLLLAEARARPGNDLGRPGPGAYRQAPSMFTLESALCTYKSWHRPNRRYPGVYNDMLRDRILASERAWPDEDLRVFWDARRDSLPGWARCEDRPGDPGCVPVKQNHYRTTGQVIGMSHDWECFDNDLDRAIDGTTRPAVAAPGR